MSRNICITAAEGQTGFAIAELLLSPPFSRKVDSITALTMNPSSPKATELQSMGAKVVQHVPGRQREVTKVIKDTGCDTICLIPPAHLDKFDISAELVNAASKSNITNVCLISSVGCDYADPQRHPHIREFIDLETLTLSAKGNSATQLGHSPVVIRAGFYAENLLLYAPQAQKDGILPLPIGTAHKFAPVALGDVAQVAAHVLTGKGQHGFDDKHRGQMMVVTGPMLCAGEELATAASQALGVKMEFENISEYAALGVKMEFENISESEARKVLRAQSESDDSEQRYILEYYRLVREGKTNYISTTAFHDVTGNNPTEPTEFFKMYSGEFHAQKRVKRSR